MLRSKYGMLEILRAAFSKADAIILLRQLSKKFKVLANDPYLNQFEERKEAMVCEIRDH